ncbi:proton-coupled amino acid transporter-like protein pathetic isoform X1 [Plodia interpunctella]|uniref:proton-coupled amino acid transporter-like protein pathetic isoform X1 n=1 Tax=Plodia interpunctella TaxID=58824 RepID=UPI002367C67F|nr:proton-coupled amino acid transporter-like protein pathetic isoform X1 [Plodia interpunctella]XP_053600135.1 proton-coupled amino acid transporter-like protein pathetic isoform X1 [Plodia interpunctella]
MPSENGHQTEKKEVESNDYNPFEHRKIEKPNSDIRAAANIIKSSLGSGLLAGPLAFSNSGWAVGIVGTVIIGLICGHCIHILVTTSRGCCKVEKKPSMDYAETAKSVFMNGPKFVRPLATAASIFTEFALVCTYVGVCCIYTVLISDSVKQLVDRYAPSVIWPVEYYCLIFMVPLCLLCQIKYLKFLAIFSMIANILLMATYLICLYYTFGNHINFADRKIAGDPARYPAFISTVIFAMEGIGVVMPVENAMKKPKHLLGFPSVLFFSMAIIVFLYGTLGLFGYLQYGDVLRGSITLNLPMDDWPAICAKVFIASSIFFTYPLQFFIVMDIFTKYTDPHINEKYKTVTYAAARTIGVCCCVGIGVALPLLEQIINLVGAVFYAILGFIIPSVLETIFRGSNHTLGRFHWVFWKNLLLFIFGLTTLISGCTVTISDIVKIITSKTE